MSTQVKLKNVRLAFPQLWSAKASAPGADPKFSAVFLVPKGSEQAKMVEDAYKEALELKFGKKAESILKQIWGNSNSCCVKDGDASEYDGYQGHWAISANNKMRVPVFDRDKSPLSEEDGKPYGGCYVNAMINFFGYDNVKKGLSAGLKGVQFAKDGEAFGGGGVASEDDFDDMGEDEDDDIPF